MEVGKLAVQHRATTGKGISRVTRREGDVPGVCYGHGLETPLAVTLNVKALKGAFDPEKRRNTVLDLTIEGEKSVTVQAMVWDFQISKLRREITHVDLKSIDPEKEVEAVVPVVSEGSYAGAVEGGLLSWARHEVKVTSKPALIPTKLVIDIAPLALGDTLHISDIVLPEGVSFAEATKLTIVTCIAPKGLKSDDKDVEAEAGAAEVAEAPKA
ncbi:MAG: 50S ribosomal protein L25 [Myxococcales bacterium]|nr:50S ribosomal protein L25 [Myxococcales bacterium]